MTSRERMLTAMRGGVPDRVPAAPDTNWMIPARLAGGGFILSTGDQCGRDTPDENITTLVDVCERYGRY